MDEPLLPPMPRWLDVPDAQRAQARAMQFQLQFSERMAPELLASHQLRMLQRLFAHAVAQVPWYREHFGDRPLPRSWADWGQLPLLTRTDVQAAGEQLFARAVPPEQGPAQRKTTSGSTGRPVEVLFSRRANDIHRAITHRDHLWRGHRPGARLAIIRRGIDGGQSAQGHVQASWGDGSDAVVENGPAFVLDSALPVQQQFAWLRDVRPHLLLGYPSIVDELARLNDDTGRPLRLAGITTFGEMLQAHQRARIEASFRCIVGDMYSSQEVGYIALQCPRHPHYHVQSENCLVEVLDDAGEPCRPGQTGQVVITPLHNYATPLIRYAIGDHAEVGAPCDCGIRLPVLAQVLGRTRNLVLMPDGSCVRPRYDYMALAAALPRAQFQLVQETREDIVLRVGHAAEIPAPVAERLADIVRAGLGPFRVRVERLAELPRGANGKFEEIVSRVAAP